MSKRIRSSFGEVLSRIPWRRHILRQQEPTSVTTEHLKTAPHAYRRAAIPIVALILAFLYAHPLRAAQPPLDTAPGKVTVQPSIDWHRVYDSNVFATESDTIDDWINIVEPRLLLIREDQQVSLELDLGAALGRYDEQSRENYDDYWLGFELRNDLGARTRFFGGFEYRAEHEGRDSPNSDISGVSPTPLDSRIAQAGLLHKAETFQLRVGGMYEMRRFDDVASAGGILVNADRNRDHYGLGSRLSHVVNPTTNLFMQVMYDKRAYQRDRDRDGFVRDSYGYRAAAGVRHRRHAGLLIEAFVGGLTQNYQDERFSDDTALDFGAQIDWRVRPATRIGITATRSLEETIERDASGYLVSEIDIKLQQDHQHELSTEINGYCGYLDYRGIARRDHVVGLGGTIKYSLSRSFSIAARYNWLYRDTTGVTPTDSLPGRSLDYRRHTLSLTLTAQLP